MIYPDAEILFQNSIAQVLIDVEYLSCIDLVVGIPFYNESESLLNLFRELETDLNRIGAGEKSLIVAVGDPAGAAALEAVRGMQIGVRHLEFLMSPGYHGRGASIRAIMAVADRLEADLILINADSLKEQIGRENPDWLQEVVEPIRGDCDFVLATRKRPFPSSAMNSLLVLPLLKACYGYTINGELCSIYALSNDLVEQCLGEFRFWPETTRSYGIDPWLLTRSICWGKKICVVELTAELKGFSLEKLIYLFRETAHSLFECIKRDEEYWLKPELVVRTPDCYTSCHRRDAPPIVCQAREIEAIFKRDFNRYRPVFQWMSPPLYHKLTHQAVVPEAESFDAGLWSELLWEFLFSYRFSTTLRDDDIINGLAAAFCGRLVSLCDEIRWLQDELTVAKRDHNLIITNEVSARLEEQTSLFLERRRAMVNRWRRRVDEDKPPLVPEHYLEFIPGVPVALPKRIEGRSGLVAEIEPIFNRLQAAYQDRFNRFVEHDLGLAPASPAAVIGSKIRCLMWELEECLDRLLPGELTTSAGVGSVVRAFFKLVKPPRVLALREELLEEALINSPPTGLMISLNYRNIRELVEQIGVKRAVSLACRSENREWIESTLRWLGDRLQPSDLKETQLEPVILSETDLDLPFDGGDIISLNRLSAAIVTRPLNKGMGGDFPKLYYFLSLVRQMMIAESYSAIWHTAARERKNFSTKILNTLNNHYATTPFTPLSYLDNYHYRSLVKTMRNLAGELTAAGQVADGQCLAAMCNGYGLSLVLADGTFIPCSAWSWASYSYKGGKGIPSPLSCSLEEKWFNADLLQELYQATGYDPEEILPLATRLISDGKGNESLLDHLLGIKPPEVTLVIQKAMDAPPAGQLIRYTGNPILKPLRQHFWESRYVLNAAALRFGDRVYLLYRAYGDDEISRIGLAVTDGYQVLERLESPIFFPENDKEHKGVEDPRTVVIDGNIFMLYTAYDGTIAQISAASIPVDDFLARRFDRWQRKGLAFQGIWDKDAILFPEKIEGSYLFFHRIEPGIWATRLEQLQFPAPKTKHAIIMGPRPGMMWDSVKIGAGAQPIKTEYGWLLIYHGVDRQRVYRLGVVLTELAHPETIIYRSPNPVLSPEVDYEIGVVGVSWVPRVVFTCGAVPSSSKEMLGADDTILVYYGAADSYLCLASATVGELIPEAVRQKVKKQ